MPPPVAELVGVRRCSRLVKTRTKRILWIAPLVASGILALAFIRHGTALSGYVASYSLYGHDSCDVLDFTGGAVTLRTCCGDESWGTYSRSDDGTWHWSLVRGTKKILWQDTFAVHPGLLSMTFTSEKDPSFSFTLRRRLFSKLPL